MDGHTHIGKARASRGFTLIEIIITIVVAAVLATLAAPSFREYMTNQKISNASFDLVASLAFARSEAITRNAAVDIIPANAGNWAAGWRIQFDPPPTGGGDEIVLRTQSAYEGLSITDPLNPPQLTYANDGRPIAAFTATIEPATPTAHARLRCIRIGLSGVANSTVGGC